MANGVNLEQLGQTIKNFFSSNREKASGITTRVSEQLKKGAEKIADAATEHFLETAEMKAMRQGMHSHLENFQMLAIAALIATVATTLFFSFFTMLMGGITGALFTLGIQGLGATASVFCYDVIKTCSKAVEITSHPKNFAILDIARQLEYKDLLVNQCQKLVGKAVEDTLLFKYVYNSFGDKFWTVLKEFQPQQDDRAEEF